MIDVACFLYPFACARALWLVISTSGASRPVHPLCAGTFAALQALAAPALAPKDATSPSTWTPPPPPMLRASGKERELFKKNASLIRHEPQKMGKKFPPLATRRTKSSFQPQAPRRRASWVARGAQEYWRSCLSGHRPLSSCIAASSSKFAPDAATPNPRAAASAATVKRSVPRGMMELGEDIPPVHATHQHDMQSRQPRQCRHAQGRPLICVGGRRRPTLSLAVSFPRCHTWRQDSALNLPGAHLPPASSSSASGGRYAAEGAVRDETQSTRLLLAAAASVTRLTARVTRKPAFLAGGPDANG